jgi:SAM-dependent methyltransferase
VGEGVEIGALHRPLRLPRGAHVRYVDRLSLEGLKAHYPELRGLPLVTPDVIDDGELLDSLMVGALDFVVANHFLEHTENPIATVERHLRVLRPGGVLFYTLPDKRYTFDVERSSTPLDHVLRDYNEGPGWSRRNHFEEWVSLVDRVPAPEVQMRAQKLDEAGYSIHFHVWTLASFLEVVLCCQRQLGFPIEIEALHSSVDEFIVVMRKSALAEQM